MINALEDSMIYSQIERSKIKYTATIYAIADYLSLHNKTLLIIADNFDRIELIYKQQIAITLLNDLARHSNVSVIAAIREGNFKTLGHAFESAQNIPDVRLKPLIRYRGPNEWLDFYWDFQKTVNAKLLKIVNERVKLMLQHIPELMPTGISSKDTSLVVDVNAFISKFCISYEQITGGILGAGYYMLCNHSLRELMPQLGKQVLRIMFGPEREQFYKLTAKLRSGNDDSARANKTRTKLNSFLYKMILSEKECIPSFNDKLFNIFVHDCGAPVSLKFIILDYLLRTYQRFPNVEEGELGIRSATVVTSDLIDLGVSENDIDNALRVLSGSRIGYSRSGFLEKNYSFSNGLCIRNVPMDHYTVFPAGRYFVERLSITCEYAFWCIMNLELDESLADSILKGKWDYQEVTYRSDKLKLDVILKYLDKVLIIDYAEFKKEIFAKKGSIWWRTAIQTFCLDGKPYPIRLIESIKNWVRYTDMNDSDQDVITIECNRLLDSFGRALSLN